MTPTPEQRTQLDTIEWLDAEQTWLEWYYGRFMAEQSYVIKPGSVVPRPVKKKATGHYPPLVGPGVAAYDRMRARHE